MYQNLWSWTINNDFSLELGYLITVIYYKWEKLHIMIVGFMMNLLISFLCNQFL
jgi:hypothetical protein